MTDPTLIEDFAQIGILAYALFLIFGSWLCGYLFGRPDRTQAAILARALNQVPRSPDPIMAAKEAKLLKQLEDWSQKIRYETEAHAKGVKP